MVQELKNSVTAGRQSIGNEERDKRMKRALRMAEKIRRGLEGRRHSDSTKLIAEDRKR